MLITTIAIIPLKGEPIVITIEKGIKYTDARATAKDNNLSSMEYHIHKSLKIGKVFKIKFVGLAVANSRILFGKDCLFLGFPSGFMRFPICLDRFF